MTLYRMLTELEDHFDSLQEVEAFCEENSLARPAVPLHYSPAGEDTTTRRICVAESLVNCAKGIGLFGVFKRCQSAVPGAKSYATLGREVYPVIVQRFTVPDFAVTHPTTEQVPDVETTHELWLEFPIVPDYTKLAWVGMYAFHTPDDFNEEFDLDDVCHMDFSDPTNYDHPWLNGRGHPMNSSEMEEVYGLSCQ